MSERCLEGCTFSPELSSRINTNKRNLRTKSVNTSYSQIFQYKKQFRHLNSSKSSLKSSNPQEVPIENTEETEKSALNYTQLSPYNRKFSYQAGINIKKFTEKARPMVRYGSTKIF